jgi:peptidoglycan/LPS O-acetylase OafA/YrhL
MFFILGFALFRRFDGQLKPWEFYLFSAIIFWVIDYKFSIQYLVAGFVPWLLIAFWPDLKVRGLRWLGMISYSLYLIHLPLGKKLIPLAARYIEGDGPRLVFVVFLFCFTLLLAYGFYQLIERPAIRWSKLVRYGDRKVKSEK